MKESDRQIEMKKAEAEARKAKESKDWDMYEFWMNKKTFLWAIGKQES